MFLKVGQQHTSGNIMLFLLRVLFSQPLGQNGLFNAACSLQYVLGLLLDCLQLKAHVLWSFLLSQAASLLFQSF